MGNNQLKELGISRKVAEPITIEQFDQLWQRYDRKHSRKLSYKRALKFLRDFARETGTRWSKTKAESLITKCDEDRNGTIEYDEFKNLFSLVANRAHVPLDISLTAPANTPEGDSEQTEDDSLSSLSETSETKEEMRRNSRDLESKFNPRAFGLRKANSTPVAKKDRSSSSDSPLRDPKRIVAKSGEFQPQQLTRGNSKKNPLLEPQNEKPTQPAQGPTITFKTFLVSIGLIIVTTGVMYFVTWLNMLLGFFLAIGVEFLIGYTTQGYRKESSPQVPKYLATAIGLAAGTFGGGVTLLSCIPGGIALFVSVVILWKVGQTADRVLVFSSVLNNPIKILIPILVVYFLAMAGFFYTSDTVSSGLVSFVWLFGSTVAPGVFFHIGDLLAASLSKSD